MCVRCGTGRVAWCTDPYRHGESAEPVMPGQPTQGAVTEWALSYIHRPLAGSGLPARRVIQPYPDEAMAREAVASIREMAPEDEPRLMRRDVGPWIPAPEEERSDD